MSPDGRVLQGSRAQDTAIPSAIAGAVRICASVLRRAVESLCHHTAHRGASEIFRKDKWCQRPRIAVAGSSPHHLALKTSWRCRGPDDPGSTPGVDIHVPMAWAGRATRFVHESLV
jgi:hypothetical protein